MSDDTKITIEASCTRHTWQEVIPDSWRPAFHLCPECGCQAFRIRTITGLNIESKKNDICEFCGDSIEFTSQCDSCGSDVHEQCLYSSKLGTVCPYCYEISGEEDD